jgi:uncharacterized membrane protein
MGRAAWIFGGIVAGGILHILVVFGIPRLAERDAWSRLSASAKPNTLFIVDDKSPARLPFTSPDVVTAYCLLDLTQYNVVVKSPLVEGPWSLSVSTRSGENFYLVTGLDAKKPEARLLIIPRGRLSEEASTERTEEGDEQNIVVSPAPMGIVAIRAPLRGESFRGQTMAELKKARCEVQKPVEPVVASVDNPPAEAVPADEAARRGRRRRRR